MTTEIATFAGGCFWCLEGALNQLRGVHRAVSGYMGGVLNNPTYEAICTGKTGHAEVVQVEYSPGEIDYTTLLEVFFSLHDPTQLNRQGNDVGTQYRSVVFFHSPAQEAEARHVIHALGAAYTAPIVTEVSPAQTFWPAEAYHQGYALANPNQPYCLYVVSPKLAKFRKQHGARLKANA